MSSILFVGDDASFWPACTGPLERAGHVVEIVSEVFAARGRLSGPACDVVVVDVRRPDGGTGLLIEQARAAWPNCAVLALVPRTDLRRTKVHQMGLWTPDAVLVHPVACDVLLRTVNALASRPDTAAGGGVELPRAMP